jgi:hypothetical protein
MVVDEAMTGILINLDVMVNAGNGQLWPKTCRILRTPGQRSLSPSLPTIGHAYGSARAVSSSSRHSSRWLGRSHGQGASMRANPPPMQNPMNPDPTGAAVLSGDPGTGQIQVSEGPPSANEGPQASSPATPVKEVWRDGEVPFAGQPVRGCAYRCLARVHHG